MGAKRSSNGVATRADLRALEASTKADLRALEASLEAKLATKEELRATNVVLEQIRSGIARLSEGIDNANDGVMRRFDVLEERYAQRTTNLEAVVREHSVDIRTIKKRLRMTK